MDSNFLLLLVATLVLIYTIQKLWKYLKWRSIIMKIPAGGGSDHPFFGSFFDMKCSPDSHEHYLLITRELMQSKEGISRFSILNEHNISLYKAETVKPVMSNKMTTKAKSYNLFLDWLGLSLFISDGERWQKKRKMLTPAFHLQILEQFIDVFNKHSQKLVSKLMEHPDGSVVDIYEKCGLCTLDVIIETSFGRTLEAQDGNGNDFVHAVNTQAELFNRRMVNPFLRNSIIFGLSSHYKPYRESINFLHAFADETIQIRKEARAKAKEGTELINGSVHEGKKRRKAFLDLLLDKQEETHDISDTDIRDEVSTFLLAGQDTTATASTYAIFVLGNHPEKQKLLHEELDDIFGESDRPVTADDLKEMRYLECIIKESLRLYDTVPIIDKTLEEDLVIGKYTLPAGTVVNIMFRALHRDPEVFPDPEEFKPERFFPENSENRHPFAFIPFSGGPRNCIGQKFAMMEEKTMLATIFRKFRCESVLKQNELRVKLGITIIPESNKLEVKFYRRQ